MTFQKLKTVAEVGWSCSAHENRGVPEAERISVFRRMCQLVGNENDDPSDPLVRDFCETLAAYEQLLTEKNGRTQPAHRTRQKIANKGVYESLVEWTRGKVETEGFRILVEAGLPEYTGEYLVVRYADRFPPDVVSLARERLAAHDIAVTFDSALSLTGSVTQLRILVFLSPVPFTGTTGRIANNGGETICRTSQKSPSIFLSDMEGCRRRAAIRWFLIPDMPSRAG